MQKTRLLTRLKIFCVGVLGAFLLRLLNLSLRWTVIGFDGKETNWPTQEPRIIAFWHAQQLLMPWVYLKHLSGSVNRPFYALISQHSDGRIIAKIVRCLGIGSIAGSSSRRGLKSMLELIEKLKGGNHIAITPDGPKGPACHLKGGVVMIAQKSGASIYPTAIGAQKRWTFKSWDKMFLPKPFSKAVLIMGERIVVPPQLNAQENLALTQLVESAINAVSKRATEFQY